MPPNVQPESGEHRRKTITRRRLPVQQRARHTVDAIIQATAELVSTRRFDEVNTRMIAERAGVSIGSLYQYFPTYEAILLAWYEHIATDAARRIRIATVNVMDLPLRDAIRYSCKTLLGIYELHWLPLIEMPRQVPQIEQVIRFTSLERLNRGNIMLYLSQHPEFNADQAEKHAFFIETFVNEVMERFVVESPPFLNSEDVVDEVSSFICFYLDKNRKSRPDEESDIAAGESRNHCGECE
jgi:AcrR family transcriptional regulator